MKKLPKNKKAYQDRDGLTKATFTEFITDILRTIVPNADQLFDFSAIRSLNLEARPLPGGRRKKGSRIMDLLFEISLLNDRGKKILINVEIEDSDDRSLPLRKYTDFSRLWDRYQVPIISIVIYTGQNKNYPPVNYKQKHPLPHWNFSFMPIK